MNNLWRYLAEIVTERLGRPVRPGDPLLGQPGFDSLAIVAVVDRIEEDLGLEFPPELLMPETFSDIRSLAAAVVSAGSPTIRQSGGRTT